MVRGPHTPAVYPLAAYLLAALLLPAAAKADPVADFYKGKTVNFFIGTGTGGEYDLQTRLIARHMTRHIPGNPTAVPQNMPGAGGAKMASWLYGVAPKDGTQIGVIQNNFPASQAVGALEPLFDVTKFNWIGAMNTLNQTIAGWADSGVKTFDDLKTKEYIVGASGRGAITYTLPAAINALLGTKMKIITGYQGGNDINLAMERGEVHIRTNAWGSWKSTRADWLAENKIVILAQSGPRAADLPNVPSLEDMTTTPDARLLLDLIVSVNYLGRPQATTPGVAPERVKALRDAFQATMKDAQFLAEADKLKLEVAPVSGEALTAYIVKLQEVPERLRQKAKDMLGG